MTHMPLQDQEARHKLIKRLTVVLNRHYKECRGLDDSPSRIFYMQLAILRDEANRMAVTLESYELAESKGQDDDDTN